MIDGLDADVVTLTLAQGNGDSGPDRTRMIIPTQISRAGPAFAPPRHCQIRADRNFPVCWRGAGSRAAISGSAPWAENIQIPSLTH